MSEGVIYKIENKVNGKIYIGSTNNKARRWRKHKWMLKNNRHHNIHLQRAFNEYGSKEFEFSMIEIVQKGENLLNREDFYIKYWNYHIPEMIYNEALDAKAPTRGKTGEDAAFYGKHHNKVTKQKISKSMKGRMVGEDNPMYGQTGEDAPMYDVHRTGKDAPNYGNRHTEAAIKKMSSAKKGKELTDEHKKHISEAKKGEKNDNSKLTEKKVKIILHLLDGGHFTQGQIGKMFGVARGTVTNISTGETWSHVSI